MVDTDARTRGGSAYVPGANGHPFVVHVHPRNDYAHFTRSFESQNIGFLDGREEKMWVAEDNLRTKYASSQVLCSIFQFFSQTGLTFILKSGFQRSAVTHIANGCELLTQVVGFEAAGGFHRVQAAVVHGELGPHEVRPATRTQASQSDADGCNGPADVTNLAGQIMQHYIIRIGNEMRIPITISV